METVNPEFHGRTLTNFHYLVIKLAFCFFYNLFDTGRMDTSVSYKALQG